MRRPKHGRRERFLCSHCGPGLRGVGVRGKKGAEEDGIWMV